MPTLTHYQTIKTAEVNAIATISAKLDAPDLRMDDFALMVKAAELIENVQDPDAFDALKAKIVMIATWMWPATSWSANAPWKPLAIAFSKPSDWRANPCP